MANYHDVATPNIAPVLIKYSSKSWQILLWLALGVLLACTSFWTSAHQIRSAITTIEANRSAAKLEIVHRFQVHDAEHAVQELFNKNADLMLSQESQQQFVDYLIERFGIFTPNNTAITLELIGYEIEGKHLWVYQESDLLDNVPSIQIVHNALRDIWLNQTNTVNIKTSGTTKTLVFTGNTEVVSINLEGALQR